MRNLPTEEVISKKSFISRDGYEVNFAAPSWKLNKDVSIRVSNVAEYLDVGLYDSYREVLAFYARGYSPNYVDNLHDECLRYFEAMTAQDLFSVESLISYRALLGRNGEPGLAKVRIFIKKWHALGYTGIPVDAVKVLEKWTLWGGERGKPIRSMCPETGPLTDIEMDAVLTAATDAYSDGCLSLLEISIFMTIATTGRRPIQITALKVGDLQDMSEKYFLNVPRAKQRVDGGWRRTFKRLPIVEDLWLLLQRQASAVYQKFCKYANVSLEQMRELPLFPNYRAIDICRDLSTQLTKDVLHLRVDALNNIMAHIGLTLNVVSERTGERIRLNAYRFRYTLGTNLGREGKGEYIIAEALDHTDTQHTGVYVKNLPEIVERIDKAVAYQLAPIAQAFQGIIIRSEHEATRGDDPASRISNGSENLGNCGSFGFCSALAPVACYTCRLFQPWLDGPHERVLDHLQQERDRVLDLTGDRKIASINDRLILAVADLVLRCNKMKEEALHGRSITV
jgi:integrase